MVYHRRKAYIITHSVYLISRRLYYLSPMMTATPHFMANITTDKERVYSILLTYIYASDIIVARETVASATILLERYIMSRFMKILNNISRSQAIYRGSRISADDLQSGHYAFILTVCRETGRSQEDIAKELCVNKSTVARNINYLEEKGYVSRKALPFDKRQFSVYPTEKALAVLPEIKEVSNEWMKLLSEGIPESELDIFDSVLRRMEEKARDIIEKQEADK